ncbi:MAG: GntR family transcriptional regulator [Gemmatimonadota bacterium]|jgi:GntR family transcriptional regulator
MRVQVDASDSRPIYVQIMDEVRRGLLRGTLRPEDPLPSVRELASDLRINPRTVLQAYAALEREGVVYVRRGQGTFVSADIKPDERERPRLALEVARRALMDAQRSGLTMDDLLEALRALSEDSLKNDGPEGGKV